MAHAYATVLLSFVAEMLAALGATAATSPTCSVALEEQLSRVACVRGENYDCYRDGRSMWVSSGCRGTFRCSGTHVKCNKAQRDVTNCTCLMEGFDTYSYASVTKSVQMLRALEEKRSVRGLQPQARTAYPDEPKWLGTIISADVNKERYRNSVIAVSSVGFAPMHIPAAVPSEYSGKRAMIQELFGRQSIMISMTPYEIALLIGHKRALRAIATSKYAWGAVFEDDVFLHLSITPIQANNLLTASIETAEAAPARAVPPLLYIGSCQPQCEADVVMRRDQMALAPDMDESLVRVGQCKAFCTHAYALSRRYAEYFFDDVFGCTNNSIGCASECDLWPCYMDWAMMRYFERHTGESWIVGGGLQGPFVRSHRGLFIQNRSAQLGNKVGRSGLAKSFRWSELQGEQSNESAPLEGVLEERACERGGGGVETTSRAAPLEKVIITIEWRGRLGNLMFEAAMLAGMVQRLRRVVNNTQAATFGLPSSVSVPARELFNQFPMTQLVREERDGRTGFEQGAKLGGCEACQLLVTERWANACDQRLLRRVQGWVSNPPRGCKVGRIKLEGYFQSFMYFHELAGSTLRSTVFSPSYQAKNEADNIMASVRRELNGGDGWKVVGVQVRLGDKSADGLYHSLYAYTSWDYYRNGMTAMAKMLTSRGARNVAFVVTAGGTLGSNANDVAWARRNLTLGANQRLFFSTAQDPYVDMAVLRGCDALVIGPSSFGWWSAYLANLPPGHVVAPRHVINPLLSTSHYLVKGFNKNDYYPPEWRLLENDGHFTREFLMSRAAPPPAASPPPPRQLSTLCPVGIDASALMRSRCFLRVVGNCPSFSRPQYRKWWPVLGGVAVTSERQCAHRQQVFQKNCAHTKGIVEMAFCGRHH